MAEYSRLRQVAVDCGKVWSYNATQVKRYLYIYKIATTKEELPVSGIRQAVVTCRRGTSVARSPKLLALPYPLEEIYNNNHHTTYNL